MRLLRGVVKVGMWVGLLVMESDNQCSKLMDSAQVLASNGASSNHFLRRIGTRLTSLRIASRVPFQ